MAEGATAFADVPVATSEPKAKRVIGPQGKGSAGENKQHWMNPVLWWQIDKAAIKVTHDAIMNEFHTVAAS